MKPRTLAIAALVLAGTAVCARLGFWQVTRWHEKRHLNQGIAAALAAPPLRLGAEPVSEAAAIGRRIATFGRFDTTRQVLLAGRAHEGVPGVDVVTPLLLAGETLAVLVDRGWVYAADAARVRPLDYPERRPRAVLGLAAAFERGAGGPPVQVLEADSVLVLSALRLDLDSLGSRFPYALAPYVLRELPGAGVPAQPARREPRPFDEFMHVSYAAQWFSFATIMLVGSAVLAWTRRRRSSTSSDEGA
ncbi:MAG: hypothetical protein A2W00_09675 [Candidatus Eisenbacteria bacterium RBG_16_71_46]|nr:MAG: hypothetical protein A2W00_09675 [Candidatus Eisenbacteria bacterium RBG_16_71_46]